MAGAVLSPNLFREPSWQQVARRADRLTETAAKAALATLEHIFTPDYVAACDVGHPLFAAQLTWAGRMKLLELGHAAAREGVDDAFAHRLRDPEQLFGTAAELRAALMARRSGAVLVREPSPGQGDRVAEHELFWPSGRRAILEVKAFRQADNVRAADRVAVHTLHALTRLSAGMSGARARIEWSEAILDTPSPHMATIDAAVASALVRANATDAALSAITVPVHGVGTLLITPEPSAGSLVIDTGTYAPADTAIYQRLRRRAANAMNQVAGYLGLPGIVVLDIDACGTARNGLEQLAHWARKQPLLGAVIAVDREHSAAAAYGNIRMLPGPRIGEVAEIAAAFERCSAGHWHYQPLCTPENPCPCAFWLSRAA